MERNKTVFVFIGIIVVFVILFVLKLGQLQLWDDKYITTSSNLAISTKVTIPQRGLIYDRNGKLLVVNSPIYDVSLTYGKGLPEDFNVMEICRLLKIDTAKFNETLKLAKKSYTLPFPLKENLTPREVVVIQERLYRYPNISIETRISRDYLVNTSYHVLGSIRKISKSRLEKDSAHYYSQNDRIGVSGVEASYEKELRGEKGVEYYRIDIRRNILGRYKDGAEDKKVIAGKDLTLTIDYELQAYAEKLMQNKRGAAVAIEPSTGEILAMVSSPYINPNEMKDENFNTFYPRYRKDSIFSRLNNKAAAGTYPPGSPFKLLTGLVAMQENIYTDSTRKYVCHHGYQLGGGRKINCHCGFFGTAIKVDQAIAKSCNNFFCSSYRDIVLKYKNDSIGLSVWRNHLANFGLDTWFHNDVYEGNKGIIPTADMYNKMYGNYSKGAWRVQGTVSNGIGQGEVTLTPLQMANFTAAIANKGWWINPHIVKDIDGKPQRDPVYTKKHMTGIDEKYFASVIKGMEGVFDYGTARKHKFRHSTKPIRMGGKTGTAQNSLGKTDHSLFVLIAPIEKPTIAIAVIVENGGAGATSACPIASLMAEKYINDTISRPAMERSIMSRNFTAEYKRQANVVYKKRMDRLEASKANAMKTTIKKSFELINKVIQDGQK